MNIKKYIFISIAGHITVFLVFFLIGHIPGLSKPKKEIRFINAQIIQLGYKPKDKRVMPVKKFRNPDGLKKVPDKIPKKVSSKKVKKKLNISKTSKSKKALKASKNKRVAALRHKESITRKKNFLDALESLDGIEGEQKRIQTGDRKGSNLGGLTGVQKKTLESYGALLRARIRSNYRLSGLNLDPEINAVIRVWISANGGLIKRELISSSGNLAFDRQLVTALKRSVPFPVPPSDILETLRQGVDLQFFP